MKKLSITLALILCLVLCVLAFASCGKKGAKATTAEETAPGTTAGATTAADTTAQKTQPPHVHVPEDEYTIDLEPTCTTPGEKSLYCLECGMKIPDTTVEIPPVPDAHTVTEWDTDAPTLLKPVGSRTGECVYCGTEIEEDLTFEHNVQIFTTSSGGDYTPAYATLGEIRGDQHFYPTDTDPEGLDLLVEYSVLWNETLLNLDVSNNRMPTIDTRFVPNASGTNGNSGIVRWELASDTTSQWCTCKFAGGFEVAAFDYAESDNPYPRFNVTVDDITAYPNIGGANAGDGEPLGETQWGWHRVSIRFREEVTNVAGIKAGEEATYKLQAWVYVDGVMVLHYWGPDHKWGGDGSDRKLYSAASDGEGGIVYTENDRLYLHGAFLDSIRMREGKGYFEIADYSVTLGPDFVQNVCKVYDPVETTMEVEEGVTVPTTMWYTYTHEHVAADQFTVDLAPTCTVAGSQSKHCTICGMILPDTIAVIEPTAAAGHTPAEDYTVDVEPTCAAPGSRSKHCTVCGEIVPETVESIDMVDHTPATVYTVDLAATCSSVGSKSKHCTVCNAVLENTVAEVPIDPTAHVIPEGTITVTPTLLADGKKVGECVLCNAPSAEISVSYEPPVIALRAGQKTKFTADPKTLGDIRGENHYYEEGNDLLIEYSILWDEAFLGMRQTSSTITAVETRLASNDKGTSDNHAILRLNLDDDTQSEWVYCKYAGGIEVGAWGTGDSESDNPYPRFDQNNADATAYPNIGGANLGDGQPLGDTQWGWHRVSIRYREEVTNVDAVKAGEAATYKLQMWVYIDGVLVLHFSDSDHMRNGVSYKLFTAESDGEGGITYVENDALYLHGAFMDSTRLEDGKDPGYSSIADYSVTVGTDFVQNVKKVTNPTATTWEIASGVVVPSTMWYELAD